MKTREDLREEQYQSASEGIRDLYASPIVGTTIRQTFDALGLPKEKYFEYVHIFGDAFLGIEPVHTIRQTLSVHFSLNESVVDGILRRVMSVVDPSIFSISGIPGKSTRSSAAPNSQGASNSFVPQTKPSSPQPISAPTPAPHVPVARVMPHSKAEAEDPRASTELPNALLQNLKASLMHSVPEEPLEATNPPPSYNAILNPKPPIPPTPPTP